MARRTLRWVPDPADTATFFLIEWDDSDERHWVCVDAVVGGVDVPSEGLDAAYLAAVAENRR